MRRRLVFLVAALLMPGTAHAELWQFWPELDVFWSMRKELRLVVIAAPTREMETGTRLDFGGGVYLDFLALHRRPFAHFTPDAGKHSRLDVRVGYARTHDATGTALDENRYVGQCQVRFHPADRPTFVFNRNRFELRDLEGRDLSWRYRNRTRLEDNVRWLGQNLTPYGSAEFFWDSRHDAWSRGQYAVGCEVSFPDGHLVLDLNMNLQDEWGAGETVYAPGLTLNLFF